jgi:hypothetical protein
MARVRFIGGDQARRCGRQLIVVALCLPTMALHATELDCEFNGQRVSGNNQVYLMRTSGWLRCWDRTSQLPVSEAQWVDGQPHGLNRRYQDGVLRSEYSRTRSSLREGLAREWNAQGVLLSENHYQNSMPVGLQRLWFDNGQPKSFYFQDEQKPGDTLAQIDFNRQGQITKLLCAKRVVLSVEAQACGHLGTTTTELFSDGGLLLSRVTYEGGELTKKETLSGRGTVTALEERTITALGRHVRRLVFRDDGSVHSHSEIDEQGFSFNQYFNAAGVMLSHRRAQGDQLLSEMEWDDSGLLRELALHDQAGGRWTQQFHDNGELSFEGQVRADPAEALPGRGTHRRFYRTGRPREEVRFDSQGLREFERAWDQEGRLLRHVSQPDSAFTVLMDRKVRSSFSTGTLAHDEYWYPSREASDPYIAAFKGQANGLIGAALPKGLLLRFGRHTGDVALRVRLAKRVPPVDPDWEEVVEVSWKVPANTPLWFQEDFGNGTFVKLPIAPGQYRMRFTAKNFGVLEDWNQSVVYANAKAKANVAADLILANPQRAQEAEELEQYELTLWPAAAAPDKVLKATRGRARAMHSPAQRGNPVLRKPNPASRKW